MFGKYYKHKTFTYVYRMKVYETKYYEINY